MVGPFWIIFLCFFIWSEKIVSYDIVVSQVIRTETVVVTTNNSHSAMPNTTQSVQNYSKISSINVDEILSTETNTVDKLANSVQDAYTNAPIIAKPMNDQINSSQSQNGARNNKLEPVRIQNIDILFPIKLKNVTSNSIKEVQPPIPIPPPSTQKPEKPGGTNSSNPDMSLLDRSAFVGDHCATGYAKVNGKCVEEL